nr:MAG TPA: hypothetical protein [Caudoviricetes sp.]
MLVEREQHNQKKAQLVRDGYRHRTVLFNPWVRTPTFRDVPTSRVYFLGGIDAPPPVPQGDGALPPVTTCVPCRLQYHHTPHTGVS